MSASVFRAVAFALLLVAAPAGLVRAEADGAPAAGGPDLGELELHWNRGLDRYEEEVDAAREGDCGPLRDAVRMDTLPDLTVPANGAPPDLGEAEAARAAMVRGLVGNAYGYRSDWRGRTTPLNRPMPAYARVVMAWIQEGVASRESSVAFAKGLLDGTLVAPGGVNVGVLPEPAAPTLIRAGTPEAHYTMAQASQAGVFGAESVRDWFRYTRSAASCGHVAAMYDMADFEYRNVAGTGWPPLSAISWLYILADHGEPTAKTARQIARDHGLPADRDNYARLIGIITRDPEDCKLDGSEAPD